MNKNIDHEYVKQIVADRLRSTAGLTSMVATEVNIRERGKTLATADIVWVRDGVRPEVTVIEIKLKADEVATRNQRIVTSILQLMKVYWEYANQTFLCLPKKECSSELTSLCQEENIGLIGVNIDPDDGPKGYLSKIVIPEKNDKPKKWIELGLRLEKLGMPPL